MTFSLAVIASRVSDFAQYSPVFEHPRYEPPCIYTCCALHHLCSSENREILSFHRTQSVAP
jgi:hypothetical protein